jgi:hypothetical protein
MNDIIPEELEENDGIDKSSHSSNEWEGEKIEKKNVDE